MTNGMDRSTIHALPTTWPARKSSEPKASQRKTIESTTSPTMLGRDHGRDQAPARQRRIDGEIGELRKQESRRPRRSPARAARHARRSRCRSRSRRRRKPNAEPALHEIAQHERDADHQHAGRRHEPGRDRDEARSVRHADRADIADHPVGDRNGEAEQDQENPALDPALSVVVSFRLVRSTCDPFVANPSARSWQAGHSPQP